MMIIIGYMVFALVGLAIIVYTSDEYEEFYYEEPKDNVIGDAYLYRFVDSDYDRVERELIRFADELALQ